MTLKSIDNRKASVSKLKNSQDRNLAIEQSFYTTKLTEKQKKFYFNIFVTSIFLSIFLSNIQDASNEGKKSNIKWSLSF